MASAIPEGCHTVTPHMVVNECAKAIEFYKKAFGAEEIMRMSGPDGQSVMHAELQIGNSRLYLNDEFPGMDLKTPRTLKGTSIAVHLYVEDCDASFKRAVDAGAKVTMPMADMFWGDRYGKVTDPFGHEWSIATHKEDLTPEECGKRAAQFFSQAGGECK
ncbi:MAG: VOC family protein [Phycisphaerae bacterium]